MKLAVWALSHSCVGNSASYDFIMHAGNSLVGCLLFGIIGNCLIRHELSVIEGNFLLSESSATAAMAMLVARLGLPGFPGFAFSRQQEVTILVVPCVKLLGFSWELLYATHNNISFL